MKSLTLCAAVKFLFFVGKRQTAHTKGNAQVRRLVVPHVVPHAKRPCLMTKLNLITSFTKIRLTLVSDLVGGLLVV